MTGERFLVIAEKLKMDAGVETHEITKGLRGRAWSWEKRIVAPEGRTRNQLYILAHECGHVALGHKRKSSKPSHRIEYEAEIYAHAAMAKYKIAVPEKMTERAKAYVRRKCHQAARRGAKSLDADAVEWSGYE